MNSAIQSAWLNVLHSVLRCCGDTPENRESFESCRATDPGTIERGWWEELLRRCSQGDPAKFNQLVSDLVSLTKVAAQMEQKPVAPVAPPPLPKPKLDAARSRESLDAAFQAFKWPDPEKTDYYADGFGNLCGRLARTGQRVYPF
jgi:hypothetical protein